MLDKLKQILTGERIESHVYDAGTPLSTVLLDLQSSCSENEELTEIEFFDDQGKRVQHWKKRR